MKFSTDLVPPMSFTPTRCPSHQSLACFLQERRIACINPMSTTARLVGDRDEEDCSSGLKMIFRSLDLSFTESRERRKPLELKVNPTCFG